MPVYVNPLTHSHSFSCHSESCFGTSRGTAGESQAPCGAFSTSPCLAFSCLNPSLYWIRSQQDRHGSCCPQRLGLALLPSSAQPALPLFNWPRNKWVVFSCFTWPVIGKPRFVLLWSPPIVNCALTTFTLFPQSIQSYSAGCPKNPNHSSEWFSWRCCTERPKTTGEVLSLKVLGKAFK